MDIVSAYASKDGYNDPDIAEFAINTYSDEEHAVTAVAGVLHTAFGWNTTLPETVESYRIEGPLSDEDYAVIGSMKGVRHLDMEKVSSDIVPDNAFKGLPLISISLPAEVATYGHALFDGCETLSSVICNGTAALTDVVMEGASNPNLLLYVMNPAATEISLSGIRNIVRSNRATEISLTDGEPFYAAREFTANTVSYGRTFTKVTEIDGCSGWETITVPFDVKTVSDSRGEVTPFAAEIDGRHFWLFRPNGTGWERTADIEAYLPFLIAMPNHQWYDQEAIITGAVTFRADNALITATPEISGTPYKSGFDLVANYMPVAAADDVYVINDEPYGDYLPGGVFARGLRDVRPFESYLTGAAAARYLPVFDTSEVEQLMGHTGMRIWSEDKGVCILSGLDAEVRIYDVVGQLVRIARVKAGETCRVRDLNKGIYLVGDTKLYVK